MIYSSLLSISLIYLLSPYPSLSISSSKKEPLHFYYDFIKELGNDTLQYIHKHKPRNCTHVFTYMDEKLSKIIAWPPPKFIPKDIIRDYSMNGTIPIAMKYQPHNSFREPTHYWSDKVISDMINGKDKSDSCHGQKLHNCYKPLKHHEEYIKGKTGLIIGSEYPWAESLLMRLNVGSLITMERINTILDDPDMKAYTHDTYRDLYLRSNISFDFAFSYSYIEHEGLGKSGEGLNPIGDINLMDRIYCSLKPGGVFFLAIPIGPDYLHWNTYRTYGLIRLPLLLSGWELIDVLSNFTSIHMKRDKPSHKLPMLMLRRPF